jgi:hypothetical protein
MKSMTVTTATTMTTKIFLRMIKGNEMTSPSDKVSIHSDDENKNDESKCSFRQRLISGVDDDTSVSTKTATTTTSFCRVDRVPRLQRHEKSNSQTNRRVDIVTSTATTVVVSPALMSVKRPCFAITSSWDL